MIPVQPADFVWRKARRSDGANNCVEIAQSRDAAMIRDSKAPAGPIISVPAVVWRAFTASLGRND
ncbi:MAG: DUF397 domain-containing protein [Pseudonocardiales bacterium]|nr:DUF397 domain-containing protein [Pseudonocardiales bacterium]